MITQDIYKAEKERIAKAVKPSMKPKEIRGEFKGFVFQIISDNKGLDLGKIKDLLALEYPLEKVKPETTAQHHVSQARRDNAKLEKAWNDEVDSQIETLEKLQDKGQYQDGVLVF